MLKYCRYCDNIIKAIIVNDELVFQCMMCREIYPCEDEDTLRYVDVRDSNVQILANLIEGAVEDPATIKARKKCINSKCDSDIVKCVRLTEDMKLYNICIVCRSSWME